MFNVFRSLDWDRLGKLLVWGELAMYGMCIILFIHMLGS